MLVLAWRDKPFHKDDMGSQMVYLKQWSTNLSVCRPSKAGTKSTSFSGALRFIALPAEQGKLQAHRLAAACTCFACLISVGAA